MSMNFEHAFANSNCYYRPNYLKNPLKKSLVHLLKIFNMYASHVEIAKVWEQFDKNTTMTEACLLGVNAWCVNSKSDPSSIVLKGRVICRGLLRIENFGNGSIIINPEVYIGDDCLISCSSYVEIGSFTLIGHGVQIFDNDTHPVGCQQRLNDWKSIVDGQLHLKPEIPAVPVQIGNHVWIGCNSIILKGVTIGDRSVVAAGSIVTKNVPSDAIVAGNPATVVKHLECQKN